MTAVHVEPCALEGTFADLSLLELLALLGQTRQTGMLCVTAGEAAAITVVDGEVSFATVDPARSLREVLLERGLVSEEAWTAATNERDGDLGPALVRWSGRSAAELRAAVHEQIVDAAYAVATDESAAFRFVPGPRHRLGDGYALGVTTLAAALAARRAAWDAIADVIPDPNVVVRLDPDFRAGPTICLPTSDWPVVVALDGHHTVLELSEAAKIPPLEMCQAAHRLVTTGLARVIRD